MQCELAPDAEQHELRRDTRAVEKDHKFRSEANELLQRRLEEGGGKARALLAHRFPCRFDSLSTHAHRR